MKRFQLEGLKFSRLTVIQFLGTTTQRASLWECECDCGKKSFVVGKNLKYGQTKSCGCLAHETAKIIHTKHGWRYTPTYKTWAAMKYRCLNRGSYSYGNYGGRGIRIFSRWKKFENFLADMGKRPPGLSLDRINNDGNYEPGNCRWATAKEQNNNRSISIKHDLSLEAKTLGISYGAAYMRMKRRIHANRNITTQK